MSYRKLCILLLLQIFLFIQCSTAETSDNKEEQGSSKRNSFADTGNIATSSQVKSVQTEKKTLADNNTENIKQENFKQIEFGFNIGFLVDLQQVALYKKVLPIIKQDGITDLRVYEPFTKNLVQKPELAANLLSPLTQAGFNILLCISNFPDVSSIQYNHASDDAEQNKMRSFTNRRAPVNMSAFQDYLSGFLDGLQNKNLLQNVSFEIGNEPDAKQYFWGNTADFINAAKSIKQTIAKYNKPVYCCGFTSNFANKGSSKSPDYYNFLNDNSFFDHVNLSFHFYKDEINDITKIRLPRLNNSIITEFNMYSYQKFSTPGRTEITNSPQFGSLLIKTLVFTYKNNIKEIYLFKLADTPGKQGTTGFFDGDGNQRPSYEYFKNIYNVVKNKYSVKQDNNSITITGDSETILYALNNNVAIPGNTVVSSSNQLKGKTLKQNQWVIFKN